MFFMFSLFLVILATAKTPRASSSRTQWTVTDEHVTTVKANAATRQSEKQQITTTADSVGSTTTTACTTDTTNTVTTETVLVSMSSPAFCWCQPRLDPYIYFMGISVHLWMLLCCCPYIEEYFWDQYTIFTRSILGGYGHTEGQEFLTYMCNNTVIIKHQIFHFWEI